MSQEGPTAGDGGVGGEAYWRGKYEEAIEARRELVELMKNVMSQSQLLQQQHLDDPALQPTTVTAAGRPINVQLGNILGVMPALLMFLFGVYSTATGADIVYTMIIIGAIFAAVFLLYLMSRPRPAVAQGPPAPP
jgi:hypothetical protein